MRTLALLQRSGCKAFPEVEHGRQPAELGCRIKNTRLPPAALAYLLGFAFSWKRGGMSAFAERFAAHLSGCGAELRRKASVKAKAEMLRGRGAWPPPGLVCSRNGGCSPISSPPFSLGVSAQAAHLHGAERGRLCTPWGWGLGTWRGRGGGRGGWRCRPRGHQRSDVQGGRGRETGSFSFPPVGGGEHGNNAGRQRCGGHGEPARSLLAKTNSLHPVRMGRRSRAGTKGWDGARRAPWAPWGHVPRAGLPLG